MGQATKLEIADANRILDGLLEGKKEETFSFYVASQRGKELTLMYTFKDHDDWRHIFIMADCDTGCGSNMMPPEGRWAYGTLARKKNGFWLFTRSADVKHISTYWNIAGLSRETTQPQIIGEQQPDSTPPTQTQAAERESPITNTRVIEMSRLGLDDDIIIAKIRNGSCEFQLEDTDLVNLKKAGVSPKVIAAMLDANVKSTQKDATKGNEEQTRVQGSLTPGTARVASIRTMQTYSQDEDGSGRRIRQVYRLETTDAVYDVTGWERLGFGGKAGKRPALEIGEVVSYRVDPKHAQFIEILLTDTNKSNKSNGSDISRSKTVSGCPLRVPKNKYEVAWVR